MTDQCNADFLKWVNNQLDIYILDGNEKHYPVFSLYLMRKCIGFSIPCQKNNEKVIVSKKTKTNLRKAFGLYTKDNTHCISVISTSP
jgi:hypothetical protein